MQAPLPTEGEDNLLKRQFHKMSRICGNHWRGWGRADKRQFLRFISHFGFHLLYSHQMSFTFLVVSNNSPCTPIPLWFPYISSHGYRAVHLWDSVKLHSQATGIHIKICLKKPECYATSIACIASQQLKNRLLVVHITRCIVPLQMCAATLYVFSYATFLILNT
jgi:hypothetical protein